MTSFFANELKSIFIFVIASTVLSLILFVAVYLMSFTSKVEFEKSSAYECGFAPFFRNFLSFRSTICSYAIVVLLFDIEVLYLYPLVTSILSLSLFDFIVLKLAPLFGFGFFSVFMVLFLKGQCYFYLFTNIRYLMLVAAPAFSYCKNFSYNFFKKVQPILKNKLKIMINCMFVSPIVVMLVYNLNSLGLEVMENCSIAVSLLSRKTLLCHTLRYSHIFVRGVKGMTTKNGPSPKVPPNSDQAKTNGVFPVNKTETNVPLLEITKPMDDSYLLPTFQDASKEKSKSFHKPKMTEADIKNQSKNSPSIDNIKKSCWEYGKNKDKELSTLQEQTKKNLLTFTNSNQGQPTKQEKASTPCELSIQKITPIFHENAKQDTSSLQDNKPTLVSLYENTKNGEHTTASATYNYPNDQGCITRIFIPSSRHPDEMETQNKNTINQYNTPYFSKIKVDASDENITFVQSLYEAWIRGLIKADDKVHKDSILLDENDKEIIIPAQKIPIKLTAHGQRCIKDSSTEEVFPHNLSEGNIQIKLAVIDSGQTAKDEEALFDSNQTHILVTADNGKTYYAIGVLTSSKKQGDFPTFLTDIQFKEFQDQQEGKNPIKDENSKNLKPQHIKLKTNLEKINSNKAAFLKDGEEYLTKDEDIIKRVGDLKGVIIQKSAKIFDFSGITLKKLKNAILFHDIQVVSKNKGSPKFKKIIPDGEEDQHKKFPKTQTKLTDHSKNDE